MDSLLTLKADITATPAGCGVCCCLFVLGILGSCWFTLYAFLDSGRCLIPSPPSSHPEGLG